MPLIGGRCPRWLCPLVVVVVAAAAAAAALLMPSPALAAVSVTWSAPVQVELAGHTPRAISCPSPSLCVAVDESKEAGYVVTSADPAASSPSWTSGLIDGGAALESVSCPSATLCVAVDQAGYVLVSTTPSAGAGSWSQPAPIDASRALTSVSCPTASLCVAVDRAGNVLTSTNPVASAWKPAASIDGGTPLQGVSCATESLCVAVDDAGRALASSAPTAAGSWRPRAIDPARALHAVSCAGGLCVAVDSAGNVLASADPTSATPTWSSTGIDPTAALTGVSCVAAGACVAVDSAGGSVATDEPLGPQPAWSPSSPDPGWELVGVSCPADGFCAAIDAHGRALTASISRLVPTAGEGPAPPVALVQPRPSISGVPAVGARLVCNPGVPSGTTATLAYAWWRDEAPIPGATAPGYRIAKADATHHLQCRVTATNSAGSATGHSAFVTVPAEGVLAAVGETVVGTAHVRGARVEVPLTCSPHAAGVCVIALRLTAVEALRANRVVAVSAPGASMPSHARRLTVMLGAARARLAPGQHRTLVVTLSRVARRLLARERRLPAQLTVSGTVIGVLTATLSRQRLTLGRASQARMLPLSFNTATPAPRVVTATPVPHLAAMRLTTRRLPTAQPVVPSFKASHLAQTREPRARVAGAPTALTPTPYMGWDTYFAFGPRYSEATVLAQASALIADGLERRGYRYVWLDVGWWQGQRGSRGQIVVNRSQWPHGLAWLTSTLHAAGLLAGLYTDAGSAGCGGAHQGSWGHYRQDANAFAAWGFDAVKVDFCGGVRRHLDPSAAYASFHAALQANSSRRPMLLSICDFLEPGQFHGDPPFAQSAFASYTFGPSVGNSWRTDTDIGSPGDVTFATVLRNLDADAAHPEAARPGHWNDPDYLGPDQGMTDAQFQAQLGMWAVLAAPLMVSDDLERISPASLAALRNPEIVAIDQDPAGAQGTLVASSGEGQVWVKPLRDGTRAVALLNRGPAPLPIQTSATAAGLPAAGRYLIRNVWAHATNATSGAIAADVPGESAVLLRVWVAGTHARPHG